MYLTALGQFLLVRVSPLMALGALVVVALAILASAQIGLRNAVLRARTWALGQAMGWPRRVAIQASMVEAGILGIASGVVGASAGALIGDPLFGTPFSAGLWALAAATIFAAGSSQRCPQRSRSPDRSRWHICGASGSDIPSRANILFTRKGAAGAVPNIGSNPFDWQRRRFH